MVYLASLCSWSSCRLDLWPLCPLIGLPRGGSPPENLCYSEAGVVTSGSGFSRHNTSTPFVSGMGKEVGNLLLENSQLLETK